MFTGLIQALGEVRAAQTSPAGIRLSIAPINWPHLPARGDSIAVSGCCLTVANDPAPGDPWHFDAIPETLAKTTLVSLRAGDRVNLEHAVRADSLMGGHYVLGHIDGVATVEHIQTIGEWRIQLRLPRPILLGTVPKGSIAIDGVSLTIAALTTDPLSGDGLLELALIPVTLEKTTLGALAIGSRVNIETDTLVKKAAQSLSTMSDEEITWLLTQRAASRAP